METLGTHLLLELYGSNSVQLDNLEFVQESLVRAAEEAGATILHHDFRKFKPQGVSGVVIIAESHLSIHTWPEYGYAAVDVFTCGNRVFPQRAVDHIISTMSPSNHKILEIGRGALEKFDEKKPPYFV